MRLTETQSYCGSLLRNRYNKKLSPNFLFLGPVEKTLVSKTGVT
jgi:hypothetical protein